MKRFINEKRKFKKSEGFTFIETMSVLAIGGILAAGTTISGTKLIEKARQTSARNQLEQYSSALQSYFLDCGVFPTTEQGLIALWEKPDLYPIPEEWNGPYVERKPSPDPWGTDFEYINSENTTLPSEIPSHLPFVLISFGADKKEGGEGNAKDICSWR